MKRELIDATIECIAEKGLQNATIRLWRFPKTRKRFIMELDKKYPDKPFLVIGSRRKMKKLLDQ